MTTRGAQRPNLADVLAAVRLGNVIRLSLSDEQKREFRDTDGQIALTVVRHLDAARRAAVTTGHPPDSFPLTEAVFQAVALKLDHRVGIKRIRKLLRRLISQEVLTPAGSYRQVYRNGEGNSGYRVRLYTLTVAVLAARSKRAVGKRGAVKRSPTRRWWQHPLFGEPDGKPPPQLGRRRANRMRSLDELTWTREEG